jgi:hypothetical protein
MNFGDPGMDLSAVIKPTIVLDGANVAHAYSRATRHGTSDADPLGLVVAVEFLKSKGHRCAVVLPKSYETYPSFFNLILNAPITYAPLEDDLFVIQMAMRYDGFILSNDKYRAEVQRVFLSLPEEVFRLQKFITERTITYAFSQEGELFLHPITSAIAAQSERDGMESKSLSSSLTSSSTSSLSTLSTALPFRLDEDVLMSEDVFATIDPKLQSVFSKDFLQTFAAGDIEIAKEIVLRFGTSILDRVLESPSSSSVVSGGNGSSHISLGPIQSSTELCQTLVKHAVSEIKNELQVSRLTGKKTSKETFLSKFIFWDAERSSIAEQGVLFLFNRR